METAIVEATQDIERGPNWGKFLIMRPDAERRQISRVDRDRRVPVLSLHGGPDDIWVLDLATGEGARFCPGRHMATELNSEHGIRVCPLYEPFLRWLAGQDLTDLGALPEVVELPDADAAIWGYRRRDGPAGDP